MALEVVAVVGASYLVGSIPFGLIAGRLVRGIDVRYYGSRRTGATNIYRTLGPWAFLLVAAADVGKGVGAVLLARLLLSAPLFEVGAALAAIVGHNWPLYAGFRGGRGVATSFGGLLAMLPGLAAACALVFAAILLAFRYVSLGSLAAALATLMLMAVLRALGLTPLDYLWYPLIGVPLLIFQHRDNIQRLLAGRERRLGEPP